MQDNSIDPLPEAPKKALLDRTFTIVFMGVVFIVIAMAWKIGTELHDVFIKIDNDSLLRLVSVRNWLGGQGWFDTMEYRLVPPDGVLMHWSRYIDAAIGGLIILFSGFVAPAAAEMLAVTIWPTFLMIALVTIVGFGTRRLFGPVAACFAMIYVLTWPFTSEFYFRAGQIDHHNVQVLMTVVMTFAAIWPNSPVRSGIIAGVAAAVALAIGLETLPYILVLGLLLFLRATFAIAPIANLLLMAFCLALGASAVILWLGQTPFARLTYPVCDQLGLPVLSLIGIAGAASILPLAIGLRYGMWRFAASLMIVGICCLIAWPFLGPCLAGPYGSLPAEVQEIIKSSITEALPAHVFAQSFALLFIKFAVPAVTTLLVAGYFWLGLSKADDADLAVRDMVGQLLILGCIGIGAAFFQVRLFSMSAGALPLLAGFALAALLLGYLQSRSGDDAIKLIGASVLIIAPFLVSSVAEMFIPKGSQIMTAQDSNCRDFATLQAVNALPTSVFLTPMNLGPALLLTTDHQVLAGPYHRSPAAFANGQIPFQLPEPEMKTYLDRIGAQHLLLCNGTNYGEGFATELAAGAQASWLMPIDLDAGDLLIFQVLAGGDS